MVIDTGPRWRHLLDASAAVLVRSGFPRRARDDSLGDEGRGRLSSRVVVVRLANGLAAPRQHLRTPLRDLGARPMAAGLPPAAGWNQAGDLTRRSSRTDGGMAREFGDAAARSSVGRAAMCNCRGVPAGLDSNPDPVVTAERDAVLAVVAERVGHSSGRTLVGIDGRSGAGKSTFADELATRIRSQGRETLRSTTDSFHRPRSERMRRGPTSATGYYEDSHQLDVIVDELLDPFTKGAHVVRVSAFDEPSDSPIDEKAVVGRDTVLIFDGLFLQRPELSSFWDLVVFLDADQRADEAWLRFLLADLPDDPSSRAAALDERLRRARWPRYRAGWMKYADSVRPSEHASIVIDNNDFAGPVIRHASP